MNDASFQLNVVTPANVYAREINYIRLKDKSGYFGILKGHIDFLTILVPSLDYYIGKDEKEIFLAVDTGILRIKNGIVTITAREVFESSDAEKLSGIIEDTFMKRHASETAFMKIFDGIEKSFIKKTMEFIRG